MDDPAAGERAYRDSIIACYDKLTFKGMLAGKAISLPLADVYVELAAVADVPEQADRFGPGERRLLDDAERRDRDSDPYQLRVHLDGLRIQRWHVWSRQQQSMLSRQSIEDALARSGKNTLVILGDPGSGKTTLLHYLALETARHGDAGAAAMPAVMPGGPSGARPAPRILQAWPPDAHVLPIFVPLAAYDQYVRDQGVLALGDFLAVYYAKQRHQPGLAPLFAEALAAGRALVLLDGLDEVMDLTARHHVAEQVRTLIGQSTARGNRFVITSRVVGYREAPIADVPHVNVVPFGDREIESFAHKWCDAYEIWAAGAPSDVALQRAAGERAALLADIRADDNVARLAANPLLLTMLALLRRQVGDLPDRRIALYSSYIEMLLRSREYTRSEGARLRAADRFDVFRGQDHLIELALWLHTHRPSGTVRQKELLEVLAAICLRYQHEGVEPDAATARQRSEAAADAERFLTDVSEVAGLVAERGQDAYGFWHLTFQEYHVAWALARMPAEERWQRIAPHLHEQRWREPILLCAAHLGVIERRRPEASELVRRILAARSEHEQVLHRDVLLAAAVVADDVGLEAGLLDDVCERLAGLRGSRVPAIRRQVLQGLGQLARLGHRAALAVLEVELCGPGLADVLKAAERALRSETCAGLRRVVLARLDEHDVKLGADCAAVLGRLAAVDNDIRALLLIQLRHPDFLMSAMSIMALGPLAPADPKIRAALVARLDDKYVWVRSAAVAALAPLVGSDEPVRAIIAARLDDHEGQVTRAAVAALAPLIGSDQPVRMSIVAKLDDDNEEVRSAAVAALAPLVDSDEPVRAIIVARLDDADQLVRSAAVGALSSQVDSSEDVRASVLATLEDEHDGVRSAAVRALAPLAATDECARAAILARLDDREASIAVITALASLATSQGQVRELVVARLGHESSPAAVAGALRALTELVKTDNAVRAAVVQGLDHAEPAIRVAAIRALAAAVEPDARALVIGMLDDEAARVRAAAAEVLGASARDDGSVRAALVRVLGDTDSWPRAAAARALSQAAEHDPEVRAMLVHMLDEDEHPSVRGAVVRALREVGWGYTDVRAALLRRFGDDNVMVRQEAVVGSGAVAMDDIEARAALVQTLDGGDRGLGYAAARELRQVAGADAGLQALLVDRLDVPVAGARRQAVHALGAVADVDAEVRSMLVRRLDDENGGVRTETIWTLGEIAGHHADIRGLLVCRLDDQDAGTRAAATRALGQAAREDAEVRAMLVRRLDDEEIMVRDAAVAALREIARDCAEVQSALLARLDDPDLGVRRAAVAALDFAVGSDATIRARIACELACEYAGMRLTAVEVLVTAMSHDESLAWRLLPYLGATSFNSEYDSELRRRVAQGVAPLLTRSDALYQAVCAMLGSPSWQARQGAAWAILAMPGGAPADALPALRALLADERGEDSWPRRLAVAGLYINDRDISLSRRAISTALAALDHGSESWYFDYRQGSEIRSQAALILGNLEPAYRDEAITARLLRVLDDPDPDVRDAAYHALVRLAVAPDMPYGAEEPTSRSAAMTTSQTSKQISIQSFDLIHLSDLHIASIDQAEQWYSQLADDLRELGCKRAAALVLSGDIGNRSTAEEYAAAARFVDLLRAELALAPQQIVLVPGNHDLRWELAEEAYTPMRRKSHKGPLEPGTYIDAGDFIELRDDDRYKDRFRCFSDFYQQIRGEPYPREYADQATLHHVPEHGLLVVGLSSAWQIDHHYKARASINGSAVSRVLDRIRKSAIFDACPIKLAVWHHPIHGAADDRITDHGFVERLAAAGFRVALHGHIHKADNQLFRYDHSTGGRSIELIAAGTFGAPVRQWMPGYPLQYNLLRFAGNTLTVMTRCRHELNGAWKPDARWQRGAGNDPASRFDIVLEP